MYELNKVVVAGRFTREPEVSYTQGEKPMCIAKNTIAVNRGGKDAGTDFINVVFFGKTGEFVEKYLKKGNALMVEGHLQKREYTTKEGVNASWTEVAAERVTTAKDGNLSWNSVELCGHVTKDPSVFTNGEKRDVRMTLAVNRRKRGNEQEDKTDFIPCVCFGKTAETAEKYLKKGKGIAVRGKIRTESYTKDGVKTSTASVVVDEFRFLHSASADNGTGNQAPAQGQTVPAQAQAVPEQQAYAQQPAYQQPVYQQAPTGQVYGQQPVYQQAYGQMPVYQQAPGQVYGQQPVYQQAPAGQVYGQQPVYQQPQMPAEQTQAVPAPTAAAVPEQPVEQLAANTEPASVTEQASSEQPEEIPFEEYMDGFTDIPDGDDDELPFN